MVGSTSAQQAAASCRIQRARIQAPGRGLRRTLEAVLCRHCDSRGAQRRQRLIRRLRTDLWTVLFSRSRTLGSMLTPSARELCPFFVRFSASALRAALVPRKSSWCSSSHYFRSFEVQLCCCILKVYILNCCNDLTDYRPALGSEERSSRSSLEVEVQQDPGSIPGEADS